ncbi:hypothetical protein DSO57_1031230 [Entomophthora muscae]|uniref:Uncharacterized protein n=1 Tax=Entomophthora muscae TaxID=34485 RepID=A0ACC2TMZ0_9FUNG|nr:hypothetical protein DSO57_1031230 [Entomophthora muscae]
MSALTPHLADQPTPWLSTFGRLLVAHPVEPDPPPETTPMNQHPLPHKSCFLALWAFYTMSAMSGYP